MDEEREWVERERQRRNNERVGAWHEEKARRASLREEMQEDATADRLLMAEGRRAQRRAMERHQAERNQRAEALVEQIFAERAAADDAATAQPRRRAAPRRYNWKRAAVMRLDGHSMLDIGHMLDLPLGRVERAFATHARLRRYMAAEKQRREDELAARLAALRPQLLAALEARLAVGDPRATIVLAQLLLTPPASATAQVAAQATLAVDPKLLRQLMTLLQGGAQGGGAATVLPPVEPLKLPEK
jgi:hypothetical protein